MIPINSSIPAEFTNGKENEIMFFADLILNNCQKYNSFDLYDVVYSCNLNKEKETQFREIYFEVLALLKLKKIIENENGYGGIFKLTKEGYKAKELGGYFKYVKYMKNKEGKKDKPTIITETYIDGDINGIYLSRNELKNATIKEQKVIPSNNPETKSSVQKIFSNPWVLLISGIAIEEVTFGRIYKYIIGLL